MYTIWSTTFLDYEVSSYTCFVNEKSWIRLHNDFSTSKMFVRIHKDDSYWICAIDSPIPDVADNTIYVPPWMLDQIGCEGMGEDLRVEFMPSEAFDHSTQIVLEPITIDEVEDIQELLSNELTKLAVLQKGTYIRVLMDGFEMLFKVIKLAPASVVLCQGDKVSLEFTTIHRRDTPIPSPIDFIDYNDRSDTPISSPIEFAALSAPPELEPPAPRFNPWRNKDFKPNIS